MRDVNGIHLLGGSDHEFVINLYTTILGRWPDDEGYLLHLNRIQNRPDLRRQMLEDVAAGEEARALGVVLRFENARQTGPNAAEPATGECALDAITAMMVAMTTLPDADLGVLYHQLANAFDAVAAERTTRIEARLTRLEQ